MPPVQSAETLVAFAICVAIVLFLIYLVLLGAIGVIGEMVIRGKKHLTPDHTQEK